MIQFLVLGTIDDPHVSRVLNELERQGFSSAVVDFRNARTSSLRMGSNGALELTVDGRPVSPSAVVWDRVKIIPGVEKLELQGESEHNDWRAKEWRAYYQIIAALFPLTLNPLRTRMYQSKPYQQAAAAAVGFRVPATLLSNSKASILAFARERRAIMKSLGGGSIKAGRDGELDSLVMTTAVAPEAIEKADEGQFLACPHFIQENIEKDFELRTVVVERRIFSFKILSQELAGAKTDWRRAIDYVKTDPWEASPELGARLHRFMDRLELFSGSFDLIVDRAGETWFLECNHDGQWGWLDNKVDGAIAKAFADAFAERIRKVSR